MPVAPGEETITAKQFYSGFVVSLFFLVIEYGALLPLNVAIGVFNIQAVMPLEWGQLLLHSLRFSLLIWGAFLIGLGAVLKGKTWFGEAIVKAAVVSACIFVPAGFVADGYLNSYWDSGEPTAHATLIIRKHDFGKLQKRKCHVVVQSWDPRLKNPNLEVDCEFYDKAVLGRSAMILTTKPGRFGHEWLNSVRTGS
jgi:hypothetical protein